MLILWCWTLSSVHAEEFGTSCEWCRTDGGVASPGSCNAPGAAETDHLLWGRSFVSQKGPSAYFTGVKTKQVCSSEVLKEQLRLERISEVTQSMQGRAGGRGIDLLWHSREHSLQSGASLLQVTGARLLGTCSLSKSVFQTERIF